MRISLISKVPTPVVFFKNGPCSNYFWFIFGLLHKEDKFWYKLMSNQWSGAGIQTQDLLNISILPLDQGFRPHAAT